jgi:hypothetical protein
MVLDEMYCLNGTLEYYGKILWEKTMDPMNCGLTPTQVRSVNRITALAETVTRLYGKSTVKL